MTCALDINRRSLIALNRVSGSSKCLLGDVCLRFMQILSCGDTAVVIGQDESVPDVSIDLKRLVVWHLDVEFLTACGLEIALSSRGVVDVRSVDGKRQRIWLLVADLGDCIGYSGRGEAEEERKEIRFHV